MISKDNISSEIMHHAIMDRIKCYANENEIYHRTTIIDPACAIINALLAWARPSMFYILLVIITATFTGTPGVTHHFQPKEPIDFLVSFSLRK